MTDPPPTVADPQLQRIAAAVVEIGKGMKSASFYPAGHPALSQAVEKIARLLEEIPLPPEGLQIGVTKNALLYNDVPIPAGGNKAIADLNRELYLRRAACLVFLPGPHPGEILAFLRLILRDPGELQDAGGLEQALQRQKVARIWANRVDYDRLTEMLKEEELEEVEPDEIAAGDLPPEEPVPQGDAPPDDAAPEEHVSIESLLARIADEIDPESYRLHAFEISRLLLAEHGERKIALSMAVMAVFLRHLESPPGGSGEIRELARHAVKETGSDELVAHCIGLLRQRGARGPYDADAILVALGDRSASPLLQALAEEEDLIVRKSIVEIVTRIGPAAVPAILENLGDTRWYMVRNMITVLGSLGTPDLAPHVASALSHPDLRVKKEAIKALSRISHAAATSSLCDLCFFPEETVALAATAALASKKDPEAVVALLRRATLRKFLFPNYRLATEAIDSLRTIGTDAAVSAIEEILRLRAPWPTKKFREMKSHALRSISRIRTERSEEALERARKSPDRFVRFEAERILQRHKP